MFGLTHQAAALLVPALLGAPDRPDCRVDQLRYVSADDRAVARFTAAAHDYVAQGKEGALFTPPVADIIRFRLRVTSWLYRYDAFETLSDVARRPRRGHAAGISPVSALPPLPEELEYRLIGNHLLLVDRRTEAVIDLLEQAMGV